MQERVNVTQKKQAARFLLVCMGALSMAFTSGCTSMERVFDKYLGFEFNTRMTNQALTDNQTYDPTTHRHLQGNVETLTAMQEQSLKAVRKKRQLARYAHDGYRQHVSLAGHEKAVEAPAPVTIPAPEDQPTWNKKRPEGSLDALRARLKSLYKTEPQSKELGETLPWLASETPAETHSSSPENATAPVAAQDAQALETDATVTDSVDPKPSAATSTPVKPVTPVEMPRPSGLVVPTQKPSALPSPSTPTALSPPDHVEMPPMPPLKWDDVPLEAPAPIALEAAPLPREIPAPTPLPVETVTEDLLITSPDPEAPAPSLTTIPGKAVLVQQTHIDAPTDEILYVDEKIITVYPTGSHVPPAPPLEAPAPAEMKPDITPAPRAEGATSPSSFPEAASTSTTPSAEPTSTGTTTKDAGLPDEIPLALPDFPAM